MRGRHSLFVLCLGLLLGVAYFLHNVPATTPVATRYHASQRTARFYRQSAASRIVRTQTVAPLTVGVGKGVVSAKTANTQSPVGGSAPVR
jgi:hypothetical protein